ncbi:hypothetical protein K1514_12000 [Paraclostridium bifermentans]|uniref:hypothetical protein n=1 Tax=Paraclostridium TaxID=1849822 RepID=UPI0012433E82|nr:MULTISPECIES: hypothetical protein [Paraclostridium]MBZ6006612.1 hypothetical protein [Paraclostridium bifermentans]MDU0296338.1 hypothetical protein [Paraclostridium sp. MRS3W1]
MCLITDFYQFKYSKNNCYIEFYMDRDAVLNIENALDERLSNCVTNRDSECAYMRLKELFENARLSSNSQYVEIRMNKCYMIYISNLQLYFRNQGQYAVLDVLYKYLQTSMVEEYESLKIFNILDEETKIRVLSNV